MNRQALLDHIDLDAYRQVDADLQDLPEEVKDCEKSVREDNPDMDKSTAIAVCRDQLDMAGECPDGQFLVAGECQDVESVDAPPAVLNSTPSPFHLAEFDLGEIERIEEGDGTVRYTGLKLLGVGRWTDAGSEQTILYGTQLMQNVAVEAGAPVHVMHDSDNEASKVGRIDAESVVRGDNGIYADVVLDTTTPAGEFADENMQATLESKGAKGFGGPSVEIPPEGQELTFNSAEGVQELVDAKIDAVGLVSNPASKDVNFARQSAERGVALSDSQTLMVPSSETESMTVEPTEVLAEFNARELQGPEDVQEEAQSIADALDVPVGDVMEVLDPLFDMGDEDEGDDPEDEEVENEDDDDGEEEEGGAEGDDGDGGDDEEAEDEVNIDLEERVTSMEERLGALEDAMESMMQQGDLESELEEYVTEAELSDLKESKEDLEKRLSAVEEEPSTDRTFADASAGDDTDWSLAEGTVEYDSNSL